jgi:uncharacterized protein YndB with AHSA1/START domain
MPTAESIPRNLSLQFNRRIPATASQIFEAWTNPELLKAWFAPGNMTVPAFDRDLRPGGAYRIEMKEAAAPQSSATTIVARGVYTWLVPARQLSYTWSGSWDPAEESHVTLSLFEEPSGTTLTLDHIGFHTDQSMQAHCYGWQSSLAKLRQLFTASSTSS